LGRLGLHSLAALDAAFVGSGNGAWPEITRALANDGRVETASVTGASLLWAFGALIGNTDMHLGNLSFLDDQGPPYPLAPAYDMTPMGFRPRSSGGLSDTLPSPNIRFDVPSAIWRQALGLADDFVERMNGHHQFSARFAPCITALGAHLDRARQMVSRLGTGLK
jgi:hypothetical protein